MMWNNQRQVSTKEILYSIIFFTIIIFAILLGFGTITSGIHMVDDHEFWRFTSYLEDGQNLKDMIIQRLKGDMSWRFRPLYYPTRLIIAAIFKTNLVLMSVLKGIETVFTCVIIYFIGRRLRCTIGYSILFVFFILVGSQSAVWWKLGPQELTGTWMFGLGILFLLIWRDNRQKKYNLLAILFFLISNLYKESFVVLIPAVMLMYIYIVMENKEITFKNVLNAIKETLSSQLLLSCIILMEMYMIVFVVGADKVSYISGTGTTTMIDYLKLFINNFRLHLRVGQYGIYVLALIFFLRKKIIQILSETKWHLFLACVMIIPQFFLYMKSGLEERYVIPWIYGVAYYFCVVLSRNEIVIYEKKKVFRFCLGALTLVNFFLVFYEAWYFAYRGKGIAMMFEKVEEVYEDDMKILSAFYPYDESETTCALYLDSKGIDSVYAFRNGIGTDIWRKGEGETISSEEADIILTYNINDRHYIVEQELDFSGYELNTYNTMIVAIRQ